MGGEGAGAVHLAVAPDHIAQLVPPLLAALNVCLFAHKPAAKSHVTQPAAHSPPTPSPLSPHTARGDHAAHSVDPTLRQLTASEQVHVVTVHLAQGRQPQSLGFQVLSAEEHVLYGVRRQGTARGEQSGAAVHLLCRNACFQIEGLSFDGVQCLQRDQAGAVCRA